MPTATPALANGTSPLGTKPYSSNADTNPSAVTITIIGSCCVRNSTPAARQALSPACLRCPRLPTAATHRPLRRANGVDQQHCHCHWTDSAGHRRYHRSLAADALKIDIADQLAVRQPVDPHVD